MSWWRRLAFALLTSSPAASDPGGIRNGDQCPDLAANDQTKLLFQVRNSLHGMNSEHYEDVTIIAHDVPWSTTKYESFYDNVILIKLRALSALGSWRRQIFVGVGLLLSLAFALLFVRAPESWLVWHICLTFAIAISWVGIAQFARLALASISSTRKSLVLLLVWANGTMWLFLGIPYLMQRLRTGISNSTLRDVCTSEVFGFRHTLLFWCIAFVTNSAYLAALSFLSASLNTAVFSTTAMFTFVLTLAFLKEDATLKRISMRSLGLRSLCIGLSVLGVVLISEVWHQKTASSADRLAGVGLSLVAAFGTAVYQVFFKYTFGNAMAPEVVGLFLAHLGAVTIVCYGAVLFGGIIIGVVRIDLTTVPWVLVLLTSVASAVFNFLIKFGIVYSSPITVSLATQLGIALNLGFDLMIIGAEINAIQAAGVLVMLASFSLNACIDQGKAIDPPKAAQVA